MDANAQTDGTIRFLLASSSNTALSGSESAIIKMTLVANYSFIGGDIKLKNILLFLSEDVVFIPTDTHDISVAKDKDIPVYNPSGQKLKVMRKGINMMMEGRSW